MTVLGKVNEKADDKEVLVGKDDVATIMPTRHRLVKFQRRRSVITLILSIGFIFIFLCGIFLTVCFIKRIGPFRRHYLGRCPVGSRQFNGHSKIFESYEITDKYALIHVPRFNVKHGTYESVRTLHVFDKKITVIQHNSMCFVKPMMKYQMLRNDWFDKLKMLSHYHFRTPDRFSHYHLKIVRPQLSSNYLRDEVHHLADAMCNSRPVFRLVYQIHPARFPWLSMCNIKCKDCPVEDQVKSWKTIGNRRCQVCECKKQSTRSTSQVDPNCKVIRCENKCVIKGSTDCVQCRCLDGEQTNDKNQTQLPQIDNGHLSPMIIQAQVEPTKDPNGPNIYEDKLVHHPIFVNNANEKAATERPVFHERIRFEPIFDYDGSHRNKRSADRDCGVVAQIYEGYTPLNTRVPIDYIHDC